MSTTSPLRRITVTLPLTGATAFGAVAIASDADATKKAAPLFAGDKLAAQAQASIDQAAVLGCFIVAPGGRF